jgi:hypothetical protein
VDARYAQLVGLCRGILADRELRDSEVVTLDQWLAEHAAALPEWPCQLLAQRVKGILADGVVEESERIELLAFLNQVTGESSGRSDAPTTLPLTSPPPFIEYVGRTFCLTGTFIYGSRKTVSAAIQDQGGSVVDRPGRCDYLVIGGTITAAWKYGTHGLKIEEAVAAQTGGRGPAIVAEEHWVTSLC